MENLTRELIRKLNFLTKEIVDLKRESHKVFLINKQVYTVKEAAMVSSLSEAYLYGCISNRLLPHSRPTPNKILIKRRDLRNFLTRNHIKDNFFNL